MTAEIAIDVLSLWKQGQRLNPYEVDEAFNMAIKALERQRWIPVSERLPEKGNRYLTTNRFLDGALKSFDLWFSKDGTWKVDEWDEKFMGDVIAWMPLPEPYRGER